MKRKRGITIRIGPLGLSLFAAGITAVGVAAVSLADSGGSGDRRNGGDTQTFEMPAPPGGSAGVAFAAPNLSEEDRQKLEDFRTCIEDNGAPAPPDPRKIDPSSGPPSHRARQRGRSSRSPSRPARAICPRNSRPPDRPGPTRSSAYRRPARPLPTATASRARSRTRATSRALSRAARPPDQTRPSKPASLRRPHPSPQRAAPIGAARRFTATASVHSGT